MKGLIIGAGIGGLLTSELLARKGLDITVFEMNRDVTHHFTGELTGEPTVKIVGMECVDTRFSFSKVISLASKRGLKVPTNLYLLNAERMKNSLFEKAKAEGVEFRFDELVREVKMDEGKTIIRTKRREERGDILIGADGVASVTARAHFLDPNYGTLRAIRYKVRGKHGLDTDTAYFYVGEEVGMGYIWLYPRTEKEFNLGGGSIDKPNLFEILGHFIKRFPGSEGWEILTKGGDLIPYTGLRKEIANRALALVGNAAGQVSSLLGGGVESTLQGALVLSNSVDDSGINPQDYINSFNENYPRVARAARLVPPIMKVYETGHLFEYLESALGIVSPEDVFNFVSEGKYNLPALKALMLHPVFSAKLARTYLRVRNAGKGMPEG